MAYDKPWHSCENMLVKLSERGLTITDENKAIAYLSRIGYYRLSGYWYAFREMSGTCCPVVKPNGKKDGACRITLDQFVTGAKFEDAVNLYVFDKKLRLLALDALERIEIAFRVEIAHLLGNRDRFAYLDKEQFFPKFSKQINPKTGLTEHHDWLTKQAGLINRSREKFIEHNKKKHGLPLPIWIACEVWDFGALSLLYSGMKEEDQDVIAAKFGMSNGRVLAKWLRSLNYLRNVCAHHSRLWNRNIIDQPSLPSSNEIPWVSHFEGQGTERLRARPFMLFCIIKHLMDSINPNSTWWLRLTDLMMSEFPDMSHIGLDIKSMGVVDEWQTLFLEEQHE
ncbi:MULTISPECIES: Abi family protein [unclassified Vibrio]|uniref:Abi family protein n=1 Tax=unclassified Vibrio TaxID=2614977 RepID=UPI0010BD3C2E|nr:Abi family protein [Vibrio sp. F13]TKF88507.1 Abi family protein [Vibrio sp. F13]